MPVEVKAKEVRAARIRSGLTQEQAGELIGYSRRAFQSWENGQRKMRRTILNEFIRLTTK